MDVFFVARDEEVGACNDVGMADDCVVDFFDERLTSQCIKVDHGK